MANYPIKVLVDEKGQEFIPISSTGALLDPTGQNLDTILASKLETNSIIAGSGITLNKNTTNHTVEINCSLPGASVIDNLTTTTAGQGSLDAHQGYVLNTTKVNISDIVNNVTSTDADKPLSAYQGYLLSNRIPNKISDLTNDSGFVTSSYHDNTKVDKDSIARVNNVVSRNLFNKKDIIYNYKLDERGNIIPSAGDYGYNEKYINCSGHTKLIISGASATSRGYLIFYDNNKNLIDWFGFTNRTIDIPSNAVYFRVSCYTSYLDTLQIEFEEQTPYVPYLNLEEAMKENVVYSTEEKRIGTWNGKPLYRKTYVETLSSRIEDNGSGTQYFIHPGITNVDEIVSMTGTIDNYQLPYIFKDTSTAINYYNKNDNIVVLNIYKTYWTAGMKIKLTMEYTKTTD